MTIRFLAPAGPVLDGRLAVVRARRARLAPASPMIRWDWDDGVREEATGDPAGAHPARGVHRYATPGVYLVRIEMEGAQDEARAPVAAARYVTVRAAGQVGASGWVRDESTRSGIPFGFLVHAGALGETGVTFRCLLEGREMEATSLGWLMTDPPVAMHFGGGGRMRPNGGPFRFRVDVRAIDGQPAGRQHLTLTLYAALGVPGRDSPILRVAGPIRPGRADVVAAHSG